MYIEEGMLVRATCNDGTTYTGTVDCIAVWTVPKDIINLMHENKDIAKPKAIIFIKQDKRYIEQEGEFGIADVNVDCLKSIEELSPNVE